VKPVQLTIDEHVGDGFSGEKFRPQARRGSGEKDKGTNLSVLPFNEGIQKILIREKERREKVEVGPVYFESR